MDGEKKFSDGMIGGWTQKAANEIIGIDRDVKSNPRRSVCTQTKSKALGFELLCEREREREMCEAEAQGVISLPRWTDY